MATTKRKAIGKKLRFEVFKRDSFRCQYCGASAPNVLLVVDHVHPVAEGGSNDILNLITACQPCNSGKGKRTLDDQSVLEKQKDQLQALNERREQLEMMIAWKEGLSNLKDQTVDKLAEYWNGLSRGFSLNETGKQSLRKLCGTYEIAELMDAMRIAADQYFEVGPDGSLTQPSVELAWSKVPGVCRVRKSEQEKPYLRDLLYIRGILRNRVYVNERTIMNMLENAVLAGASVESLKSLAKGCRSWSDFQNELYNYIDELEGT